MKEYMENDCQRSKFEAFKLEKLRNCKEDLNLSEE